MKIQTPQRMTPVTPVTVSLTDAEVHYVHRVPLEHETRPAIPTEETAYWLNRKPQTLRAWACLGSGPIRPIRVNGRLAWKVADIQAVLNGEVSK